MLADGVVEGIRSRPFSSEGFAWIHWFLCP